MNSTTVSFFLRAHRRGLVVAIVLSVIGVSLNSQGKFNASSGKIRGKIIISRSDDVTEEIMKGRMLNRYETSIGVPDNPLKPYALPEKCVVYLESVPGKFDPPQSHPALDQQDMLFRPLVLPVLVGTTVDFPNFDPLFHNVFSLSQPKEFDLGRYPKGQRKSVTFDRQGVVSVYCEIHSYMFATILILQNPFFALPDQEGNFEIPNVPPGTYEISFWYGRKKADTKIVSVIGEQATSVNFQY